MLIQTFYLTSVDSKEKIKLKLLIKKYNEILLYSVSIAVTEDLINLIIVNGDDKDFELIEIMAADVSDVHFKILSTTLWLSRLYHHDSQQIHALCCPKKRKLQAEFLVYQDNGNPPFRE